MKDAYKDAMDAVKAPDALVDKTLKRMLAEQSKREAKTDAIADQKFVRKAPARNNRWVARAALPVAACLSLALFVIVPRLVNHGADIQNPPVALRHSPNLETPSAMPATMTPEATVTPAATITPAATETPALGVDSTIGATGSSVDALTIDHLATRSGPSTAYSETGTYRIKGEHVRVISLAYDANGLCWVQCEVPSGDKLRRVYTGAKRFDAATLDLGSVQKEEPLADQAKVIATSEALYGPGDGYDTYAKLTLDKGQTVTVVTIENRYAQVEWTTSKQSYRAWVPVDSLSNP